MQTGNRFSVTAVRPGKRTNWSTSVDAFSHISALNSGLKAHFDAGFQPENETIDVIVKGGDTAYLYKVQIITDTDGINCRWLVTSTEEYVERKKKAV